MATYNYTSYSSAIIFSDSNILKRSGHPSHPEGQQGIIIDYAMPKILGD